MTPIIYVKSKLYLFSIVIFVALHNGAQSGPLHDAVNAGDLEVLAKALEGEVSIDETDWMVGTPLHVAVGAGNIPAASLLLEHGADPDAASEVRGARALSISATYGDTKMIALLLEHGADIDLQDDDGKSPLFRAAEKGRTETVIMLASRGADVDKRETGYGQTPLIQASDNGQIEVVKVLLDQGAAVDATDNRGFSALMLAAQLQSYTNTGDGSLIEFLVKSGADILRKNKFDQTPREYAQSRGYGAWDKVAEILLRLENQK